MIFIELIKVVFEVLVIAGILYLIISNIKSEKSLGLWKSLLFFSMLFAITYFAGLYNLNLISRYWLITIMLTIVLTMQFPIRALLESFGDNIFFFLNKEEKLSEAGEIMEACSIMSQHKTGALIVFEDKVSMDSVIQTGTMLNADISSSLLINIFEKNTPLHDGAVIISGNKIVAAACYLPLSKDETLGKHLGTRHRAAVGASDQFKTAVVTVSEETGRISYTKNGIIEENLSTAEILEKIDPRFSVKKRQKKLDLKKLLISTGIASLCWLTLSSITDPLITKEYRGVKVSPIKAEVVSDAGKAFQLDQNEITVRITGKKNDLSDILSSDIVANVDLSKVSFTNAAPVIIDIPKLRNDQYGSSVEGGSLINVSFDDLIEKEVPIKLSLPENDLVVKNITMERETLLVRGAKKLVDQVSEAQIVVKNITGKQSLVPNLIGIDGNVVKPDQLIIDDPSITINIFFYNTKTLPLSFNYDNKKYVISSRTNEVKVFGERDVLDNIDAVTVPLNPEKFREDLKSGTLLKTIHLSDLISKKISIIGDSDIVVEIGLNENNEKPIFIKRSQIKVIGLDHKFTVSMDPQYEIIALGKYDDVIDISKESATLDVSGLEEGEYNLPLIFENKNLKFKQRNIRVQIVLKK